MSTETAPCHWGHCARNNRLLSASATPHGEGAWGVDVECHPGGPGHSPAGVWGVRSPRKFVKMARFPRWLGRTLVQGSSAFITCDYQ